MDELVLIEILENLENAEEDVGRDRRRLRENTFNPLEQLSDVQFIQMFRLNKDLFQHLKNIIEPYMRPQLRNTDLSISTRIFTALRFYATGSYQMDIGHNQYIGVSQPSVSRSVKEVTDAINTPELFSRWIQFPRNVEELNACRLRFFQKFNFPGVIGCIDCTHVAIFPPNIEHPEYPEYVYINRKGFHSINVQIITDADMKIININARYPGSTNDAFIWQNSNGHNAMRNLHIANHKDYYLLGDSGYPLRSYLMTPIEQEPFPNTPEHRYNLAQRSVRNIIERVNGVLKMRFRCLTKHRSLHYAPEVACRIINACAVLHNLCIEFNIPDPEDEQLEEIDHVISDQHNLIDEVNIRRINPDLAKGRLARRRLIQHF